jgi:uncharacterized protein (DUF305 family)
MKTSAVILIAALALAPALAQQPSGQQPKSPAEQGAADDEYMAAMEKMHQAMMAVKESDPDRAWAAKMVEHHRGAIAMSEILIKRGDDAEAKKMAQKSMDQQKKEIGELQSWLNRHGGGDAVQKTPRG